MRTVFFAAVTMFFLSGQPLLAQGGLPPGDYQETCRDMRVNGDRLEARCQKKDGGWRHTSLDYRGCRGPIINSDGKLRCATGDAGYGYSGNRDSGRWQGSLPPGDYKRTCQDMRVSSDRLDARCQKKDGGWRDTSLKDFNNCRSGIANDDGHLTCQR